MHVKEKTGYFLIWHSDLDMPRDASKQKVKVVDLTVSYYEITLVLQTVSIATNNLLASVCSVSRSSSPEMGSFRVSGNDFTANTAKMRKDFALNLQFVNFSPSTQKSDWFIAESTSSFNNSATY